MAYPTMAVALTKRLLPAEMLERVFHLLPPREQVQVAQVCRDWKSLANHVILSRAGLPPNLLLRVFHLLPPRDLKAVVLVCRWWRELGEAPALWVWVCLRERIRGTLPEVLGSRRLQAVRRVEVWEVSEELLQVVVSHPGLKEMWVLQQTNLSSVDPELLAQAVTQLEEVKLSCPRLTPQLRELRRTRLTPQQVTAICTAMTGNSQLKKLELPGNNLSSVDADLLAQAVTQLEEVGLARTRLTPQQVEAIFAALDTSSQLKRVRIDGNDLSSVDPEVLGRVVNKLDTATMGRTQLTEQQKTRILTQSLLKTSVISKII